MSKDVEYGVDSRYMSEQERISEAKTLMDVRLIRMRKMSLEQIKEARRLQQRCKEETNG